MDYSIFRDRFNYLFKSTRSNIITLSPELGMSAPTLSRYLSGKRAPELPYLLAIAEYFHVSLDWLLGLDETANDFKGDVKEIAHLYSIASPDDRKVVQVVLEKYRSAAESATPSGDASKEESPDLQREE